MTKPSALIIAIGDKMDDKKDKNGMYFQVPEGVEAEEGQTVTLPTESEFELKDGMLCLRGISTIADKPAEPAEGEAKGDNMEAEDEEGDDMADETDMWRKKAMSADQEQLGQGNMA